MTHLSSICVRQLAKKSVLTESQTNLVADGGHPDAPDLADSQLVSGGGHMGVFGRYGGPQPESERRPEPGADAAHQ